MLYTMYICTAHMYSAYFTDTQYSTYRLSVCRSHPGRHWTAYSIRTGRQRNSERVDRIWYARTTMVHISFYWVHCVYWMYCTVCTVWTWWVRIGLVLAQRMNPRMNSRSSWRSPCTNWGIMMRRSSYRGREQLQWKHTSFRTPGNAE